MRHSGRAAPPPGKAHNRLAVHLKPFSPVMEVYNLTYESSRHHAYSDKAEFGVREQDSQRGTRRVLYLVHVALRRDGLKRCKLS